jgi:hypothetical protein
MVQMMKKKLAVFGDSFAYSTMHEDEVGRRIMWTDVLKEKYDVTNYGRAGSNLYFSYTEFLKNQHLYDYVVLVITGPGRLLIPKDSLYEPHQDTHFRFLCNYHTAEQHLKEIKNLPEHKHTVRVIEAARDYFLYIQDLEYEICIHKLLIKEILNVRPTTILIPAFVNSWVDGPYNWHMFQIMKKEHQAWGFDDIVPDEKYKDYRTCHMTEENNIIFANVVSRWIEGEPINLNLDEFVTPNASRYISLRNNK